MYIIRLWTLLLCVLWNALENAPFRCPSEVCIHITNCISVGGEKSCSLGEVCEILFSKGRIYFVVNFDKHWSFLSQNEKYFRSRDQLTVLAPHFVFCTNAGFDAAAGDASDWTDVFSGGSHEQPGTWPQQQILVDLVLTVPYSGSGLVFSSRRWHSVAQGPF